MFRCNTAISGLEAINILQITNSFTGSFTQMIWKSTREMCISYATSQNPGDNHGVNVYVVAVYYPPGNKEELAEDNITPLLDSV